MSLTTKTASDLITRLENSSKAIRTNVASWGIPPKVAKEIVNNLDKIADEIEIAAFGLEAFERRQESIVLASARQARVIQRDSDESYMNTFANPMAPVQVNADEPYMSAYRDDQSSAVMDGKATNGKPLVP